MQIALYKGPADGWLNKIAHWAICAFTLSRHSHCELVIRGVCVSASARDGGVRAKQIDLASEKWDVIYVDDPYGVRSANAWAWFEAHAGQQYDWAGIARFCLPFLPQHSDQWFCSEACASALSLPNPEDWTPGKLARRFKEVRL